MAKHEIYEVGAKIVDANGAYANAQGYPQVFDSHQNNDDVDKTYRKAKSAYYAALSAMYLVTTRQKQFAYIIRASDGLQIEREEWGEIADYPDNNQGS